MWIVVFSISAFFLSGILGSVLVRRFGPMFALIDVPNERSSHSSPVPRGGGIGILAAFALIGVFAFDDVIFILAGAAMGLLGLLEDCFELSSSLRLLVQLALSALVVFLAAGAPVPAQAAFTALFWVIFIAGTANSYNFMDGIDGMAALTGAAAFGMMSYFSFFVVDEPDIALMSMMLSAGCLGFLPFNFPRGKVFLGDVGSVFLGFLFASAVYRISLTIEIFLCAVMFLCMFYADTAVTVLCRLIKGEDLMKAHRGHLYQFMCNELKLPHWKVSLFYALVQSAFGALSIILYRAGSVSLQLMLSGIFTISFSFFYYTVKKSRPGSWVA